MNALKQLLNPVRYFGQKKAVILMYHQICRKATDPWELAVDPENFHGQLEFLKKNFEVVSLADLVNALRKRRLKRNMLAITFDDGFADNYIHAAPLLEWHQVPATFFFATDPLRKPQYYWWDVLESIIFHAHHLPPALCSEIGGTRLQFQFHRGSTLTNQQVSEIAQWTYGKPVNNERVALYLRIWNLLKPLSADHQNRVLEDLRQWAGLEHFSCRHGATMQLYQMMRLSKNPLFAFGAHSVSHAMLAAHNEYEQKLEIEQSKSFIEKALGKPINSFAYPYGNFNNVTKDLLVQSGYEYALSTEARAVTADTDLFELPRLQVKDWNAKDFSIKVREILQQ